MKVKVYLLDEGQDKFVNITGEDKPDIDEEVMEKWQEMIDLASDITCCSSLVVLKALESGFEILLKSNNESSCFEAGDIREYGAGLFCESVMGCGEEVVIPDALESETWNESPDVKDGFLAYFGLPLFWPDGEFFGNLSVFNDKPTVFNDLSSKLLYIFKRAIETDLSLIAEIARSAYLSDNDQLTNIYNRKALIEKLKLEFERYDRSKQRFSVLVVDIDNLRAINEAHGHDRGDEVLLEFTSIIASSIRKIDIFGRWSDDDFVVICPDTNLEGANALAEKIIEAVSKHDWNEIEELKCTIGCATSNIFDKDVKELIRRADVDMYNKKNG